MEMLDLLRVATAAVKATGKKGRVKEIRITEDGLTAALVGADGKELTMELKCSPSSPRAEEKCESEPLPEPQVPSAPAAISPPSKIASPHNVIEQMLGSPSMDTVTRALLEDLKRRELQPGDAKAIQIATIHSLKGSTDDLKALLRNRQKIPKDSPPVQ